jgi:hypothetical protein
MEIQASVRWLYSRYKMNETALCFRGAKFGNAIVIDYPIRVYTMDLREMDQLPVVAYKGGEYPLKRAAALFRSAQEKNGITRGADRLLSIVENGWTSLDPAVLDVKPSEEALHVIRPPVTIDGTPVKYDPEAFQREREDKPTAKKGPGEKFNDQLKKPQTEKRKPVKPPSAENVEKPSQAKRGTILATICAELSIDPTDARKRLRSAGMRAPYDNEALIREALE